VRVRDPRVGEEHLVELGLAGELAKRSYLHAGYGHVEHEVRQALVLGYVGVGTGHQDRPARLVRHRRPDLLPVHHPVVAVAYRPGGEAGEVGPGTRLAEELAPHLLAGPQWTQPALVLLVGTVAEDRRRGHAKADADAAGVVVRRTRGGELRVDDWLEGTRRADAAQPGRVGDPGEPGVEPGAEKLQPVGRRRVVCLEETLGAPLELFGARSHGRPPSPAVRRPRR
jgi:hypothetical protein